MGRGHSSSVILYQSYSSVGMGDSERRSPGRRGDKHNGGRVNLDFVTFIDNFYVSKYKFCSPIKSNMLYILRSLKP